MYRSKCLAVLFAVMAASAASAQEFYETEEPVVLRGSVGYTFLEADEIVFDELGNKISHLKWESQAPTIGASLDAKLASNWTASVNGTMAAAGDSHMEDYDWYAEFGQGYADANWTHRSIHPDTKLDHYFNGDIAFGRDLDLGGSTINLHGGFKYTDVKWTAYGGSLIYSDETFRDTEFTIPSGMRGITYRQRFPGAFLGADFSTKFGNWALSGQVRGGATISASTTDHHWLRDLRFEEEYTVRPFASAAARLEYAVSRQLGLFMSANVEQQFEAGKGDTKLYHIPSGYDLAEYPESAGAKLRVATFSGGVKLKF